MYQTSNQEKIIKIFYKTLLKAHKWKKIKRKGIY